jgi:hypothetical protein
MRPHLRGSDAHALDQIGRSSTWIKMTAPTLEGLRLAFGDGQASLRAHDGEDPNEDRSALMVEQVEIADAKLLGRGESFVLAFNPWLNAIIGGRGTGKSSIVEFVRLALDRAHEVPEALADTFTQFAQIPVGREARGMLTQNTAITVIYRKDSARFRVRWSGRDRSIEEQAPDGSWEPTEGEVAQRFPVRIYSQKQIFELAEGPEALLRVIDDAHLVDYAGWKEQWRATTARFLTLRAEAREIATAIADRGRLTGELDDVKRKLTVFEDSDHRTVLRDYAHRQKQQSSIQNFDEQLESVANHVRTANSSIVAALDRSSMSSEDPAEAALLMAAEQQERWLAELREQLNVLAAEAEQRSTAWRHDPARVKWLENVQTATNHYTDLMGRLEAEGAGSPNQYADLIKERQHLEERLAGLDAQDEQLADRRRDAEAVLDELLDMRRDLTARRARFLADVLAQNKHVQIKTVPYGDQTSAEPQLRALLGATNAFANDIASEDGSTGVLIELFRDFDTVSPPQLEQRLATLRSKLIDCARGNAASWQLRDRRFGEHLTSLTDETIDRLAFWTPRDTVKVCYSREGDGQNFRPIEQGSPGQKTAAILAFLLAYGNEPIVLDQPEDDLDNRLIYDLVVRQLRANKQRRQIIVVTHNPNIVVNGDAEYVAVLEFPARLGKSTIHHDGGLQEVEVRDEICAVMEGGRDAFEQRYRRLGRQRSRTA